MIIHRTRILLIGIGLICFFVLKSIAQPQSREIEVSDAFVRSSPDGQTWTIGSNIAGIRGTIK